MRTVVVGAGIFGVTAAIALRERGHAVVLVDAGAIPHPLAESTDISKAVRMDYGADETYVAWMEEALEGFRNWNRELEAPHFHETGVTFLCHDAMQPGGFEYESHALLARRGHPVERLDARAIRTRFPAWDGGAFTSGYFNPHGGWVESGALVATLARRARVLGVDVREHSRVHGWTDGAVVRVTTTTGAFEADAVIITTGGWIGNLVPEIAPSFRTVGQPVFHLAPGSLTEFASERFPVFGADIARTGWYGFPLHPTGVVKVANHGAGRSMPPESASRVVTAQEEQAMRDAMRDAIPALASARIVGSRVCVYCDTLDEHFWIDRDPRRPNVVVATGGSGHAFKFAPLLGAWIADALEGHAPSRFRWRPEMRSSPAEAARHRGSAV